MRLLAGSVLLHPLLLHELLLVVLVELSHGDRLGRSRRQLTACALPGSAIPVLRQSTIRGRETLRQRP